MIGFKDFPTFFRKNIQKCSKCFFSKREDWIIEANITGGQLDFHQLCNGPIWGNITYDVLSEIINNSKDVKKQLGFL